MSEPTDFILKAFRIWRGSGWNKAATLTIVAGLTSITSIFQYVVVAAFALIGQKVNVPETPTWLSLLLIILGMGFFALGRILPERPSGTNPHDVKLLKEFRALVTPSAMAFMREHNFENTFDRRRQQPFGIFASDWHGARYEFDDKKVQRSFANARAISNELDHMIGLYTYPVDTNVDWATPLNRVDEAHGLTSQTRANIKAMNDAGSKLVKAIDDFERLAKRRIRG